MAKGQVNEKTTNYQRATQASSTRTPRPQRFAPTRVQRDASHYGKRIKKLGT